MPAGHACIAVTWPRTVTCRSVEYVRRGRVGFEASELSACCGLGWLAHAASGVGITTFLSACESLDSASLRLEGSVLYQETTKTTQGKLPLYAERGDRLRSGRPGLRDCQFTTPLSR